ncbi:17385_t:CDS:2 [Gigaspora rosea]|nr:17385_t:CDS:2 [Gigaspora rosea]
MSAIANKIVEKYNLSSEMSVTDLKKRKNKTINIATSKQTPEKSEVETIREIAHRILQDNFSASDVKAKTCALANSAPNANASSSRLFRLQRELRSLNASPEVIEATKFSDITKEANEIQKDQQIKAEPDIPRKFRLLEKNKEQAKKLHTWIQYAISSGRIGDPGKPGCAVYGAIVRGAQNPVHVMTITRECLCHNANNHSSPVQNYVVVNYHKREQTSEEARPFRLYNDNN